jgi:hypothetical protein
LAFTSVRSRREKNTTKRMNQYFSFLKKNGPVKIKLTPPFGTHLRSRVGVQ